MKKLVLLVSIICSLNCFSQNPSPELFQTWYLSSVQTSDLAPAYNVYAINPPIVPTLVISNTLDFTGTGACNTFNGVFISTFSGQLQTTAFTPTTLVCSPQIHTSFEGSYFGFLQFASQYQIITQGSGLLLIMNNPIFGQAIFQNFPLKTTEFDLEKIAVYPNPTKARININANQLLISKIQIINSFGQNVMTMSNNFEVLDISNLSSGIYILKIDTELGMINKKIIKE